MPDVNQPEPPRNRRKLFKRRPAADSPLRNFAFGSKLHGSITREFDDTHYGVWEPKQRPRISDDE